MGAFDQAAIQHASALHWAQTIGKQRWVGPGKFYVYEPTYAAQPPGADIPNRDISSEAIFDADVIKGLQRAETFYMDREIAHWLVKSSMGRPPMRLEKHLLPAMDGYLWFEQHVSAAAEGDHPLALAALQWSVDPSNKGATLRLVPWIHIDTGPRGRPSTVRYGGTPMGSISWTIGKEDLVATEVDEDGVPVNGFPTQHPDSGIRIDAMLDIRLIPPDQNEYRGLSRARNVHGAMLDVMGRCVEAFGTILLFMNQRLIVSARERPSRTALKQMARSDMSLNDIVTIKLRKRFYVRQEGGTTEHREIDWQWRWPVTGHWRKPRRDGVGPRQPIYIPSYWKGPEDKPIKPANEKLFAIVR